MKNIMKELNVLPKGKAYLVTVMIGHPKNKHKFKGHVAFILTCATEESAKNVVQKLGLKQDEGDLVDITEIDLY